MVIVSRSDYVCKPLQLSFNKKLAFMIITARIIYAADAAFSRLFLMICRMNAQTRKP